MVISIVIGNLHKVTNTLRTNVTTDNLHGKYEYNQLQYKKSS